MDAKQISISAKSDKAYLQEIGDYIRAERIKQSISQEDLAQHAGVSRKTISHFESGKVSISLLTFIQLLRSLKLLDTLSVYQPTQIISPIQLAKTFIKERIRVRKPRQLITQKRKPKSDW